jgi:hypothetical protein
MISFLLSVDFIFFILKLSSKLAGHYMNKGQFSGSKKKHFLNKKDCKDDWSTLKEGGFSWFMRCTVKKPF